jgi:hypothetical protein
MHLLPFITWISAGLLIVSAPTVSAQVSVSQVAARRLSDLLQAHGQLRFQLESEYDPYQHGLRITPAKHNSQYLVFSQAQHQYLRYDQHERRPGFWRIDVKAGKILFAETASSGEGTPGQHTFQIRSFEKDRLALIWQGRHGYVQRNYRLVPSE